MTADSIIPDPLSSIGWNRYAYVGNDPVNLVDPSGYFGELVDRNTPVMLHMHPGDNAGLVSYAALPAAYSGPPDPRSDLQRTLDVLQIASWPFVVAAGPEVVAWEILGTMHAAKMSQLSPDIQVGVIIPCGGGASKGGTLHKIRGTDVILPYRRGAKDKTFGYLIPDKGDWFPIESGAFGHAMDMPKGAPGFNSVVRSHVEGHAAAYMRKNNVRGASLIINNDPCTVGPGCNNNLKYMLPEGARLRVYNPHTGFKKTYVGVPD